MNTGIFVITYLVTMLFTYLWRYVAATGMMHESSDVADMDWVSIVNWILFINYVLLAVIAYYRGKKIEKKYLTAFPIIAGFFDLILVFIPLIPTVMNIVTLINGSSSGKEKVVYIVKSDNGDDNKITK